MYIMLRKYVTEEETKADSRYHKQTSQVLNKLS